MTSRAQFRALRAHILSDLLRLGQAYGAGALSQLEYQRQHVTLSLLLREVNEMELHDMCRSAPLKRAA